VNHVVSGQTTTRGRGTKRRGRQSVGRRAAAKLTPLLWIGPALALIGFAIGWPLVSMFDTATLQVNAFGLVEGHNGFDNFRHLFAEPEFVGIVERSVIWVVSVVAITTVISLGLAQLFNKRFPGRRVTRLALIAPWAASVLMSAIVFKWMLNTNSGLFNIIGHDLGLVGPLNRADPLGRASTSFPWLIFVAVFVSLPFTTYAILAGHSSIPDDVYEAARVDGASAWKSYLHITLPLLRPAIVIATLINIMNVFNNFPIIWAMTHGQPGYSTATTTVFMYILKSSDIGESAAMAVINFGIVAVFAAVFLRASSWRTEVD
jgi:multiple sugar transport system permease protein